MKNIWYFLIFLIGLVIGYVMFIKICKDQADFVIQIRKNNNEQITEFNKYMAEIDSSIQDLKKYEVDIYMAGYTSALKEVLNDTTLINKKTKIKKDDVEFAVSNKYLRKNR